MDTLLRLLLRLVLVPLGLLCGFLATIVVVMIGYWRIGDLLSRTPDVDVLAVFDAVANATLALSAVAMTMWAVALIGVLFSEAFAVRSWLFHAANGAASAWIGAQLFAPTPQTPMPVVFDGDLYVLAVGLAGGLAYWLVAGWSAGFWTPVFAERAPPLPPVPRGPAGSPSAVPPPVPQDAAPPRPPAAG